MPHDAPPARRREAALAGPASRLLLLLLLLLVPAAPAGAAGAADPWQSSVGNIRVVQPPADGAGRPDGPDHGHGHGHADSDDGILRPDHRRPPQERFKYRRRLGTGGRAGRPVFLIERYDPLARDDEPDVIVIERPADPGPAPAEPAATAPPDPVASSPRLPARGAASPGPAWAVGEPLPDGVPHVTLDWRTYALPEPPPGRIYARVRRDVLLIDAGTRVVIAVQVASPGRDTDPAASR